MFHGKWKHDKNILWQLSLKKTPLTLIKILLVLIKKLGSCRWTQRYAEYQKVTRQINYDENYRINTTFNLKTRFIWEKNKHAIVSEMPWGKVLRKAGSDFCVNYNFSGTLLNLFKEELVSMLIHVRIIFSCNVSFKYCCQSAS